MMILLNLAAIYPHYTGHDSA